MARREDVWGRMWLTLSGLVVIFGVLFLALWMLSDALAGCAGPAPP